MSTLLQAVEGRNMCILEGVVGRVMQQQCTSCSAPVLPCGYKFYTEISYTDVT